MTLVISRADEAYLVNNGDSPQIIWDCVADFGKILTVVNCGLAWAELLPAGEAAQGLITQSRNIVKIGKSSCHLTKLHHKVISLTRKGLSAYQAAAVVIEEFFREMCFCVDLKKVLAATSDAFIFSLAVIKVVKKTLGAISENYLNKVSPGLPIVLQKIGLISGLAGSLIKIYDVYARWGEESERHKQQLMLKGAHSVIKLVAILFLIGELFFSLALHPLLPLGAATISLGLNIAASYPKERRPLELY